MKSFDDLVFEFAWNGFIIFDELDEKRCECEDCKATVSPHLYSEWGGSACAIIDGKIQNIADHLNKREKEKRLLDSQHKIS